MPTQPDKESFTREEALLAAMLASRWFPGVLEKLPYLESQSTLAGWEVAIRWHGVAGILLQYHRDALERLSPLFCDVPRRLHLANCPQALRQFSITKTLLDTLALAGVRAVPHKGVCLSILLYGDLATRVSCDIDILIDPDDFERAYDVMAKMGYRSDERGEKTSGAPNVMSIKKDCIFYRLGEPRVELHIRTESGITTALPRLKSFPELRKFHHQNLDCLCLPADLQRRAVVNHAVRSHITRWKWGYDSLELIAADFEGGNPWARDKQVKLSQAEQLCLRLLASEWQLFENKAGQCLTGRLITLALSMARPFRSAVHNRYDDKLYAQTRYKLLNIAASSMLEDNWASRFRYQYLYLLDWFKRTAVSARWR